MQSPQPPLPQQAHVYPPVWSPEQHAQWMEQAKISARLELLQLLHLQKSKFCKDAMTLTAGLMKLVMSSAFPLADVFFDDYFEGIFVQQSCNESGGLTIMFDIRLGAALEEEVVKVIQAFHQYGSWTTKSLEREMIERQLRLVYLLFHLVRSIFQKRGLISNKVHSNDCFRFVHELVLAIGCEDRLYIFILKLASDMTTTEKYPLGELSALGSIWERRNSGSQINFIQKIEAMHHDPYIFGPLLVDVWEMLCGIAGNHKSLVQPKSIYRWNEKDEEVSPPKALCVAKYYNFIRTVAATVVVECINRTHLRLNLLGALNFLSDHIVRQKQERTLIAKNCLEANDEAGQATPSRRMMHSPRDYFLDDTTNHRKRLHNDREDGTTEEPQRSPSQQRAATASFSPSIQEPATSKKTFDDSTREKILNSLHLEKEKFAQDAIAVTAGLMILSMCSPCPSTNKFFDDYFDGIFVESYEKRGMALVFDVRLTKALEEQALKLVKESHFLMSNRNSTSCNQKRMRSKKSPDSETVQRQLRFVYLMFHLVRSTFQQVDHLRNQVHASDCFGFVHKLAHVIKDEDKLYVFILKLACVSTMLEKHSSEALSAFASIWERRNLGSQVEFIVKICSLYQNQYSQSTSADPHQEILGPLLVDVWEMFCGKDGNRSLVHPKSIRRWKEEDSSRMERDEIIYQKFIQTVAAAVVSQCVGLEHTGNRLKGTVEYLNDHIRRRTSTEGVPGASVLPIEIGLDDDHNRQNASKNIPSQDPSQECQRDMDDEFNHSHKLEEEEEDAKEDEDEEYYMKLMNQAMEMGFQEG